MDKTVVPRFFSATYSAIAKFPRTPLRCNGNDKGESKAIASAGALKSTMNNFAIQSVKKNQGKPELETYPVARGLLVFRRLPAPGDPGFPGMAGLADR